MTSHSETVQKYITFRLENKDSQELVNFFTPNGVINDTVKTKKSWEGKDQILKYYKENPTPSYKTTVGTTNTENDGTYTVSITYSQKLLFNTALPLATININFKFATDCNLFELVTIR